MSAAVKRKAEDDANMSTAKKAKNGEYVTSPEFIRKLTQMPAIRLAAQQKSDNVVFVAERTDKISDVFKGLVKHNFLSCPVLQKSGHKYYGFVDVGDFVKFAIDKFGHNETVLDDLDKVEDWSNATVNDIMKYPLTRRNPFHPFTTQYSLFSVMEALAKEPSLHRIPIISEDRALKNVLTQSQVAQFLKDEMANIGTKTSMPLFQIPGALRKVVSINENKTALEAFELMMEKNVSGLAIVDDNGKLTGNLSLRDLKAIMVDARMFWRLKQTVHNFIRHLREDCAKRDGRPRTKVTTHKDDTIAQALDKIVSEKVHRIFITDENHIPIGVISLKDIIGAIIA